MQENARVGSASELAAMERRLDELSIKRSSLAKALILLRSVNGSEFRDQQRRFIRQLPHKYHAHGTRRKRVHLPGRVDVTLNVTYFHRQKDSKASRLSDSAASFTSTSVT